MQIVLHWYIAGTRCVSGLYIPTGLGPRSRNCRLNHWILVHRTSVPSIPEASVQADVEVA